MTQVDIENLGFTFLQIFQWNFKCLLRMLYRCGDLTLLESSFISILEQTVSKFANLCCRKCLEDWHMHSLPM